MQNLTIHVILHTYERCHFKGIFRDILSFHFALKIRGFRLMS